jgi:hypothetical protein
VKDSLECFRIISSAQPSKTNARSCMNRFERKHSNTGLINIEPIIDNETYYQFVHLLKRDVPKYDSDSSS